MLSTDDLDWDTLRLSFDTHRAPVRWTGETFTDPAKLPYPNGVSIADIENNENWVAFLGDTHGNADALRIAVEACRVAGITHCFHVGDFGYLFSAGADRNNPQRTLGDDQVDAVLAEAHKSFGFTLHVIDGNHDNHGLWHRGVKHNHQPYRVVDDAQWLYHPRGSRIDLALGGGFDSQGIEHNAHTVGIGFLGGARSINVLTREEAAAEGVFFWYDEQPTDDDVDHLIAGGELDILVTHEAPSDYYLSKQLRISDQMEALSAHTRDRVLRAVWGTEPRLNVHGHWHQSRTGIMGDTKVLCLDKEYEPGGLAFVDTASNAVVLPEGNAQVRGDADVDWDLLDPTTSVKVLR